MENSPFIFGLFLQSSMILALGAQNLFVLEKGLLKDRPLLVATICSSIDVILIMLGVLGAGSVFEKNAILANGLRFLGAAFLFKYAYGKFDEARKTNVDAVRAESPKSHLSVLILATLAVSLLNPHVYLDTIVLLGGYSMKFKELENKLAFAAGASVVSVIWFLTISFGASFFSSALRKPKTMMYINYGAAAIMTYLAISLLW